MSQGIGYERSLPPSPVASTCKVLGRCRWISFPVNTMSWRPAIFNWAHWNAETKSLNEQDFEERCSQTAGLLTSAYWTLVSQYLCRRLSSHELSPDASKAWTQTGLALSPLFGTVAQHSIDVIIAWALMWSSRVLFLFPPPDGQWPRHGHPQCIGELYVQRAPSHTTPGKMLFPLLWTCCSDLESVDISTSPGCGKGHQG